MTQKQHEAHSASLYEFLTVAERLALLRYERILAEEAEQARLALEKSVQEIVDILRDPQGRILVSGQSLSISGDRATIT